MSYMNGVPDSSPFVGSRIILCREACAVAHRYFCVERLVLWPTNILCREVCGIGVHMIILILDSSASKLVQFSVLG